MYARQNGSNVRKVMPTSVGNTTSVANSDLKNPPKPVATLEGFHKQNPPKRAAVTGALFTCTVLL